MSSIRSVALVAAGVSLLFVAAAGAALPPKRANRRSAAPVTRTAVDRARVSLSGPAPRITKVEPLDPDGWPYLTIGHPFTIRGSDLAGPDGAQIALASLDPSRVGEGPYGEPLPDPTAGPAAPLATVRADEAAAAALTAVIPAAAAPPAGRYVLQVQTASGGWSNPVIVSLSGGPAPVPGAIVDVGTFDAASGRFDGLVSETITFRTAPGKPERTRLVTPSALVSAPPARLRFRIANAAGGVAISASPSVGQEHPADGSIIIDVGHATTVTWTARAGSRLYSDRLNLRYESDFVTSSPQSRALSALDEFAAATRPGRFTRIDKARLIRGLRDRVLDPTVMDQRREALCGPMAILVALALKNPERYVQLVRRLYEEGEFAASSSFTVHPSSHLFSADCPGSMEPADWLPAACLRDSENDVLDYDAGDLVAGVTWPGEMERWLQHVVGCATTGYTSCYAWGEPDALAAAGGAVAAGGVAALLVDSQYLPGGTETTTNWADHWILLLEVEHASDPYRFKVFSWASTIALALDEEQLEDLLWGAVSGRF